MGQEQIFLTWVNFLLLWSCQPHLWFGFGKFALKILNFSILFIGLGQKVSGSKTGRPLNCCGSKVCSSRAKAHLLDLRKTFLNKSSIFYCFAEFWAAKERLFAKKEFLKNLTWNFEIFYTFNWCFLARTSAGIWTLYVWILHQMLWPLGLVVTFFHWGGKYQKLISTQHWTNPCQILILRN